MNKNILIALIIVGMSGGFFLLNLNSQSDSRGEVVEAADVSKGFKGLIFAAEFKEKIDSGEYIVLDIRTPEEYENQRITDDALLVDFYAADFKQQLNALDKNKKYLMHCRSGSRSSMASKIMEELGFKEFYELAGGINSWNLAGYTTFSGLTTK